MVLWWKQKVPDLVILLILYLDSLIGFLLDITLYILNMVWILRVFDNI